MKKLPISVCIASYNEGHLLEECLNALQDFEEIILIDLESKDNTKTIAEQLVTKVVRHKRIKVIEHIKEWIAQQAKFDWLLFVDPDEIYPSELIRDLKKTFLKLRPNTGLIYLPMQFYFKKHKLKAGQWGGDHYRSSLVNKKYVNLSKDVHGGELLKVGYSAEKIERKGKNFIIHKWMSSYHQLFEKHHRYLKEEGQALYKNGKRYKLEKQIKKTLNGLKEALVKKRGFKDGFVGIFLSFFWAWYIFMQWNSLKEYERKIIT